MSEEQVTKEFDYLATATAVCAEHLDRGDLLGLANYAGMEIVKSTKSLEAHRHHGKLVVTMIIHLAGELEHSRILLKLCRMPYREYLKTDHWGRVRDAALLRCDYKCQLCSSESELQVHHNTYERRGEEWETDVIALCRKCHSKHHNVAY